MSIANEAACLRTVDDRTEGAFGHYWLGSAFQPILSLAHKRPVGCEALVRATDTQGRRISPANLFGSTTTTTETRDLDRLCRHVHVRNFTTMPEDSGVWMFLNVNPQVVLHGHKDGSFYTHELMTHYGLDPHRVVVEILEHAIMDDGLLIDAVEQYHAIGCLIAIDDFGAGSSNFDRIWRFKPDIVKLDRALIAQSGRDTKARRMLASLTSLLHEAGCLVLAEGIETRDEAMISMDSDVDFVQGYFFAYPSANWSAATSTVDPQVEQLSRQFRDHAEAESRRQMTDLSASLGEFWTAARAMELGQPMPEACRRLLLQDHVLRCYLLNHNGIQTGHNLEPATDTTPPRHRSRAGRFTALASAHGADWFRRPYFRRAISHPGLVQITGPYFSLPDAELCVTLSLSLEVDRVLHVFCCDLEWHGSANLVTGSIGPWQP
jgi:EAL domain-containing protein (putative c-di-GMP-specific phosphodiesterase class I)